MNLFQKTSNSWRKFKIFFKKNIYILFFILCFLLLFFVFVVWRKPAKVTYITRDNLDLVKKTDSLEDIAGRRWAVIKAITVSKEEAIARNDSLARMLKLKPKFIKGQDIYITKTDTIFEHLPVVYLQKDSTYKIEKKDGWIDVVAVIGKTQGYISVSGLDTITRVEEVKNPLIGRTTRKIYLRNASPYNKITEGMSFTVKEKIPCLTIGPFVGVTYNGKITAGISIQYPIVIFKK